MPADHWYNEIDEGAARWLEELIAEDLIPRGVVDRRSIKDVRADDLRGFTSCHFFAGIGIWPAAMRAAGWPDDRPAWTGSCPCQPFSPAGKGLGFDDPRHLWPDWFRLIRERRPHQIFGEQSAAANLWLDLVCADLEGLGAAFAALDLPAAGFAEGAHIRQRFYWMADLHHPERWTDLAGGHFGDWPQAGRIEGYGHARTGVPAGGLAHHQGDGRRQERAHAGRCDARDRAERIRAGSDPGGDTGGLGFAEVQQQHGAWDTRRGWGQPSDPGGMGGLGHHHHQGSPQRSWSPDSRGALRVEGPAIGPASSLLGCDWLFCHDARIRPVATGTFPLAASDPTRVGLLRGYGNALDFETAVNFIGAFLEAEMFT